MYIAEKRIKSVGLMNVKLLKSSNQNDFIKWFELCNLMPDCDIYFYPQYAKLYELNSEGKACCFICQKNENDFIMYPFLKRKIIQQECANALQDEFYDITAPYGYGGYLRNNHCTIDMKFFFNLFQNYCNENNIIAEFVRFSPWLKTQIGCDYFLDINFWNKVVGIDLRKSKDEIWADFDSKNRNRIRKSIKNGVFIKQDLCFTALDEFYRLYHVTMDRNNALAYYYFDMQFFRNMIQLLANNIAFFHAFLGDTIIASLMVIYAKNYAHAHLACSDTNYLNLAPGNLLFYEVALWAKKSGFKYLFLGGGKNSDPDDSLLRFKKRFSKTYFDFYLGKKIHNKEIYSLLVQKKLQYEKERHVIKIDENFFPQYRRL